MAEKYYIVKIYNIFFFSVLLMNKEGAPVSGYCG